MIWDSVKKVLQNTTIELISSDETRSVNKANIDSLVPEISQLFFEELEKASEHKNIYLFVARLEYEAMIKAQIRSIASTAISNYSNKDKNSGQLSVAEFLETCPMPSAPFVSQVRFNLQSFFGHENGQDFKRQVDGAQESVAGLLPKIETAKEAKKRKEKIKNILQHQDNILVFLHDPLNARFIAENIDKFDDQGKIKNEFLEPFAQELLKHKIKICTHSIILLASLYSGHLINTSIYNPLNTIAFFALHKLAEQLQDQDLANQYRQEFPIDENVLGYLYDHVVGSPLQTILKAPDDTSFDLKKKLADVLLEFKKIGLIAIRPQEEATKSEAYFLDQENKDKFKDFLIKDLDSIVPDLANAFIKAVNQKRQAITTPEQKEKYCDDLLAMLEEIISVTPQDQKQKLLDSITIDLHSTGHRGEISTGKGRSTSFVRAATQRLSMTSLSSLTPRRFSQPIPTEPVADTQSFADILLTKIKGVVEFGGLTPDPNSIPHNAAVRLTDIARGSECTAKSFKVNITSCDEWQFLLTNSQEYGAIAFTELLKEVSKEVAGSTKPALDNDQIKQAIADGKTSHTSINPLSKKNLPQPELGRLVKIFVREILDKNADLALAIAGDTLRQEPSQSPRSGSSTTQVSPRGVFFTPT